MNTREGSLFGAIVASASAFFAKLGEVIDWTLLLNSSLNAMVGAGLAAIAVYAVRKWILKDLKPKASTMSQEDIESLLDAFKKAQEADDKEQDNTSQELGIYD